ncbi:MAG TPA: ATP-binding protein, partial [Candidatus Kapabacteria bacterium]|nr:ATP-binding protein [Candidatus Kapabacteria bacterium]
EYLKTLHDTILYKDIVKRHNIRSIKPMGDLSRFLISNSGSPMSYRNLAKLIGLKSVNTIAKYLQHFVEAFLFFEVNAFSVKYKEQVKSNKKIYTLDNGIIGSKAFNFTANTGVLYENMVAVELKRRELKGELEFYYYKNPGGYEIDFVVKEGLEITQLIQVCYSIADEKTKAREIRALIHGYQDLKCGNLMIITGDYENEETVEWFGIKGKVHFIPLWKWLLEIK